MPPLTFAEPVQLTSGEGVDLRPNWNTDSRSVVFERLIGGERRLYRVGLDGTGATPLDLCNRPGSNSTGRAAFFGPDDFAFVSDRNGRPGLWRADLRAGTLTSLLQLDTDLHGPATAGKALLYFQKAGEDYHVHRQDVGQLTHAPGTQDQPWPLPDGRSFVYHVQQDGLNLAYHQAAEPGASPTDLSGGQDEGSSYLTPYPSPDGRWLAFSSARTGISQVYLMRQDGSERRQVTSGPPHSFPAWSPDGRRLVVVRGEPTAKENPSGELWSLELG